MTQVQSYSHFWSIPRTQLTIWRDSKLTLCLLFSAYVVKVWSVSSMWATRHAWEISYWFHVFNQKGEGQFRRTRLTRPQKQNSQCVCVRRGVWLSSQDCTWRVYREHRRVRDVPLFPSYISGTNQPPFLLVLAILYVTPNLTLN